MIKSIQLRILFLFVLVASISHGQGYRGKRFSLAYQPGYSMVDLSYDFGHIIMHQKLNLGMTLGKHFSVNLTGSYTNSREMTNGTYENLQINDITGGITFSYFYKNHQSFAPIGRYFGIGVDFGRQNLERIVIEEQTDPYYYASEYKYYDNEETTRLFIFSAFFGKNFLIKEKLLLGYGIQYGICSGNGPVARHCIKPQFIIGLIF